ncbi:MAG: methylornithine synthase PylB [Peptostreptococcaceae bacterium]|nr:methylornithine synthase PylB [Peptostreptococcaceae bacterium]
MKINIFPSGEKLSKEQIVQYLTCDDDKEIAKLFEHAKNVRNSVCGNKIYSYGFVYFTTYCRNNCNFCYFRASNKIERYRKSKEEVLEISKALINDGVNLIDLTMGEDPEYHKEKFQSVLEIIDVIKGEYDTPVMISPGVIPNDIIDDFAAIKTDWYALYQETHNRELFSNMRIGQEYDERMDAKLYARDKGMLIEEGLLAGIGESPEDIADSLLVMGDIKASQMRVMSFIPQEGSPMENVKTPTRREELTIIALMRIMYPHVLIPASLDVDGISGLKDRINAGANLVTSIIPPKSGFMGVAHSTMDVDEGGRTIVEVKAILNDMGLELATKDEYKEYEKKLKEHQRGI